MAVIGLCGLIGSGKGTAADLLVSRFKFKKVSFADSLKDSVSVVFGWPRHLLEGDTPESRKFREEVDPFWSKKFGKVITPRYILQFIGTDVMRDNLLDSIWVDSLEKKISNANHNYVIPDVRFPNEIEFIQKMSGVVMEIKRGKDPEWYNHAWVQNSSKGSTTMQVQFPDVHVSEWAWIGGKKEWIINNDGSMDELEANLRYALTSMSII